MYLPSHFNEPDIATQHQLIRTHPLGTWVLHGSGGIEINHIPFLLDAADSPNGTLLGHVARANPVWKYGANAVSVVVFNGEQGYVSPSWYPGKQEQHRVVPTWNYAVVHAHGTVEIIDDRPWLLGLITRLTDQHEAANPSPWRVAEAPADYVDKMLGAIVGIRIRIDRLEGKFKLSQNRPKADQLGVIAALRSSSVASDHSLGAFMNEYYNLEDHQ